MTLAIFLLIAIIVIGIQTVIPFLVKRTIIFGVTIPEIHVKNEVLTSFKKRYAILVSLLSILVLVGYVCWAILTTPTEEQTVLIGVIIEFGIILFSLSLYFYFHGKTLQLKKKQKWMENLKQMQISDLSARSQDEMLPWYVYLVPILVTVGIFGYTVLQYDLLPEQIPIHWDFNGQPDAFTEKSPFTAIQMPLMLLALQIMFLISFILERKKSGIKLSATSTTASRIRQLTLRKYTSWFTFFVSLLLTLMFSFFQLQTIHPDIIQGAMTTAVPILFLVLVLAGTIIFAIRVGRSDKGDIGEVKANITDYDEDAHWVGGLIYVNRHDPSIFVEKRFGVGWTLNFGNPIGVLIILIPLIIILIISFL